MGLDDVPMVYQELRLASTNSSIDLQVVKWIKEEAKHPNLRWMSDHINQIRQLDITNISFINALISVGGLLAILFVLSFLAPFVSLSIWVLRRSMMPMASLVRLGQQTKRRETGVPPIQFRRRERYLL